MDFNFALRRKSKYANLDSGWNLRVLSFLKQSHRQHQKTNRSTEDSRNLLKQEMIRLIMETEENADHRPNSEIRERHYNSQATMYNFRK